MEQTTHYHEKICLCKKCKGAGEITFFAEKDYQERYPLRRNVRNVTEQAV